jgi:hypothetical protein
MATIEIPLKVNLIQVADKIHHQLSHEDILEFILLLNHYVGDIKFTEELSNNLGNAMKSPSNFMDK